MNIAAINDFTVDINDEYIYDKIIVRCSAYLASYLIKKLHLDFKSETQEDTEFSSDAHVYRPEWDNLLYFCEDEYKTDNIQQYIQALLKPRELIYIEELCQ